MGTDPRADPATIPEPRAALPTRPEGASTGGRPKAAGDEHARSLASQTAHLAMRREDTIRAGDISLILALLGFVGLLVELLVIQTGYESVRRIAMGLLGAMFVGGIVVRSLRNAPDRVRLPVTYSFGVLLVAVSIVESLHMGVFSAVQGGIVLAMCGFGAIDRRFVLPLTLAACVGFIVPAGLISFGVIADPGVFAAGHATTTGERVACALLALSFLVAALGYGRVSRRRLQAAVERTNAAMLLARQRDLLLAEANRNLEVVLHVDARRGGRYTGVRVGNFDLEAIVGRGAMGEVYAATRAGDGRPAAVKLLTERAAGDAALVKRFLREVEHASRLRSPNIVEVLEAGEAPDGSPYLAMELLVGNDLARHLRQKNRLPLPEVVSLVDQVARGLEVAHDAGIVHRDLKPQNLFLHDPGSNGHAALPSPVWKILDFGVSKLRDSSGTLTEGAVVGTPGYIAPEQVQSGSADARADVFALGAVAYRALTGQPPFGVQDVQALFDVVYRQPTAPREVLPDLPRDVELVLGIALAKTPGDRFATARELAEALALGSLGSLSPELRGRAEAILGTRPWGSAQPV